MSVVEKACSYTQKEQCSKCCEESEEKIAKKIDKTRERYLLYLLCEFLRLYYGF